MEQDSPDVRSQEWTFSCCCVSFADWRKSLLGGHIRQHSYTLCSCVRLAALLKNVNQGWSRSKCRQSVESKWRPKFTNSSSFFFVVILHLHIFISMHVFWSSFVSAFYMCILHLRLHYHLHLLYAHRQVRLDLNSYLGLHPVCM